MLTPFQMAEVRVKKLSKMLFIANILAYTHFMNKMLKFLLSSQLIWPKPGQDIPTKSHPVCSVYMPDEFCHMSPDKAVETMLAGNPVNLVVKLNKDVAYITLHNNFNNKSTKYYFQWEGDPVFKPKHPAERPNCTISSLLGTLSALHERLRVLELADVPNQ